MIDTNLTKNQNFNINYDLGHLLVNDAQPFIPGHMAEADLVNRAEKNLSLFYQQLFKLVNVQKGADDEGRDFQTAQDNVKLPKITTILPRAKPIPKPKALTKWDKYRLEKGMAPKQKRGRMVFSEATDDWVPRWGKGR